MVELAPQKNEAQRKTDELLERLNIWFILHQHQVPLGTPISSIGAAAKAETERGWNADLLENVVAMESSPKLSGQPAEKALQDAINLAQTKDPNKLAEIATLLRQVHKALRPPSPSRPSST